MHRVVITGMGAITALGSDLPTMWNRLVAGENGIRRITYFDASEYSCQVAAEVRPVPCPELRLSNVPVEVCRRSVRLFLLSAREAYRDSGLADSGVAGSEVGVAVGASVNYLNMGLLRQHFAHRRTDRPAVDLARLWKESTQPAHTFYRRVGDLMAGVTAKMLGVSGPACVLDTACAASAFAVGEAFRQIRRGRVRAMVAGGGCGIVSPIGILAFALLGALSPNPDPDEASRPFDRHRDGFVMGEGGGAVVLEELEHARARGARIYAEVAGFGMSLNAGSLTDPSPDGVGEEHAMRLALADGSIPGEEIDYIAAHGTSTPKNDVAETLAIKRLFGRRAGRLLVSSSKGQIGHTISAAGVCNLISAAKAITTGYVPPTGHYRNADPLCDLDYVPHPHRRATVRAALANAFAFGGQNAALAVRAPAW